MINYLVYKSFWQVLDIVTHSTNCLLHEYNATQTNHTAVYLVEIQWPLSKLVGYILLFFFLKWRKEEKNTHHLLPLLNIFIPQEFIVAEVLSAQHLASLSTKPPVDIHLIFINCSMKNILPYVAENKWNCENWKKSQ